MLFDMRRQVQGAQLPFFHDDLAANYRPVSLERGAEDYRCQRILPGAGVFQRVEVDSKEICTLAYFQRANILPAEHRRSAARG